MEKSREKGQLDKQKTHDPCVFAGKDKILAREENGYEFMHICRKAYERSGDLLWR